MIPSVFNEVRLYGDTGFGYRPVFIMLVGIPGSGKSTTAKQYSRCCTYLSSDDIRQELFADATFQGNNALVFEKMHERTILALRQGKDVIYDATNITRKDRASILSKIPPYVKKECIVVWASIEECIERDAARERTVGKAVIDKMLHRFEAPFYDEGFDKITVETTSCTSCDIAYLNAVEAMNIPHDNPHHSANIVTHCALCGDYLKQNGGDVPGVVITAGYLHDVGKPYVKSFYNKKGERCDTAHYYDHQAVGAWMSYGFRGHNPVLAWLISTHMAPFINQKYYNSIPLFWREWIDVLHKADKEAH